MKGIWTTTGLIAILLLAPAIPAETTTVLLVRHAEKVATTGSDPELTEEGRAHAEMLAAVLADVELAAIYSTPFRRTRDTVAPVAKAKGLEITVIEAGSDLAGSTAARILGENRGRTVLVSGHSNTLGPTLEALGAGPSFELDESEYGDLFVCTIPEQGAPSLLRLKAWR
jgi:2,3-bisphosphoglycerate-dependent phosphoglycerate mutase